MRRAGDQRPRRQMALRTRSRSMCLRATRSGSAIAIPAGSHGAIVKVQNISGAADDPLGPPGADWGSDAMTRSTRAGPQAIPQVQPHPWQIQPSSGPAGSCPCGTQPRGRRRQPASDPPTATTFVGARGQRPATHPPQPRSRGPGGNGQQPTHRNHIRGGPGATASSPPTATTFAGVRGARPPGQNERGLPAGRCPEAIEQG